MLKISLKEQIALRVYLCIRVTNEAEIVEVTFHGFDLDINDTNFIQISRNQKFVSILEKCC